MQPNDTNYAERLADFGDWIRGEMARWKVPGTAVAVITKDEVLLAEGYGQRDVENNLPVTADTLFAIGSCTKAFTTFGMGLLVDEGKLDWDTPLREYLPDFRLHDPVATEYATPRDIVTHRIGLPRHDLMWLGSPYSRQELFKQLRHLKPNKTFRQIFQYQNLMYMTAGYLIEQITGTSWEDFTRTRILEPLGMKRSNLSVDDSPKDADHSLPYELKKDEAKAIPFRNIDAIGPAGSINSSINEMIPWLRLHLNGGQHNGQQMISEKTLHELHTPQIVMAMTPDTPWYGSTEIGNTGYALGWATQTYRGHTMLRHMGGIDGFISSVSFFPHEGIGIIILTNLGDIFPATIFSLNLFDRMLGLDQLPWSDRMEQHKAKMAEMGEKGKAELLNGRKANAQPSHAVADYCGDYQHPAYGSLCISLNGAGGEEKLHLEYNGLHFTLTPHHYDTFQLTGDDLELLTLVNFYCGLDGSVCRIELPLEPTVEAIAFERA